MFVFGCFYLIRIITICRPTAVEVIVEEEMEGIEVEELDELLQDEVFLVSTHFLYYLVNGN